MENPAESLAFYVVFVFSVTVHEAAHAWAAQRGGDLTAYLGGQVSLDPRPHIRRAPFGMVVLPILSLFLMGFPFGFASTPFDPAWADRHPRRAAWMALAGPASNLLLVLLAALALRGGIAAGYFFEPSSLGFTSLVGTEGGSAAFSLAMLFSVVFSMNLLLATLNLIPLPPLDGSGALGLLLSPEVARRTQAFLRQPMFGWIGILVAWRIFDQLFPAVFLFAVNLLHPGAGYR